MDYIISLIICFSVFAEMIQIRNSIWNLSDDDTKDIFLNVYLHIL